VSFGITEIIIVAAVVLLLFGSKAIPKVARSLGSARNEFEAGQRVGPER
jgi:sec-independent protein translocase protein TatA